MRTNTFCTAPTMRKGKYTSWDIRSRFKIARLESQQGFWVTVSNRKAYLLLGQAPRFMRDRKTKKQGIWYAL